MLEAPDHRPRGHGQLASLYRPSHPSLQKPPFRGQCDPPIGHREVLPLTLRRWAWARLRKRQLGLERLHHHAQRVQLALHLPHHRARVPRRHRRQRRSLRRRRWWRHVRPERGGHFVIIRDSLAMPLCAPLVQRKEPRHGLSHAPSLQQRERVFCLLWRGKGGKVKGRGCKREST